MNNNISSCRQTSSILLMPESSPCYEFSEAGNRSKKTVWLVPHIIKYKNDSDVITWRCNWGNICESKCLYAMIKDRNIARIPVETKQEAVAEPSGV